MMTSDRHGRAGWATAAILAGGLGTRLRPVVAGRPKVMAEIHGHPFLAYLFDQLVANGLRRVVVCTGYLGDHIASFFGSSYDLLTLVYSQEAEPLGTGGALRLSLPLLESERVLALNGDSFCDADLRDFAERHERRGAEASLLLTEVDDTGRFGSVKVGAGGAVTGFEEKGGGRGPGLINAGVYMLERSLIEDIPPGVAVSLEREVFPARVGEGLYGDTGGGRFLDIGTPESFAAAEEFFAAR